MKECASKDVLVGCKGRGMFLVLEKKEWDGIGGRIDEKRGKVREGTRYNALYISKIQVGSGL